MARIATTPWDLATAPDIPIFDPVTLGAYGRYMNGAPDHDELNVPPTGDEHMGWAYGAFLIERYCRWRAATRELDLVYLLSLSAPYQVQLMRTTLRIVN